MPVEDPLTRRKALRDVESAGSLYGPHFFSLLERASTTLKAATGATITDPNELLRVALDFQKSKELWPSGFCDYMDTLRVELPSAYSLVDMRIDRSAVLLVSDLGSTFVADIVGGKIAPQSGWVEVVEDTSYVAKAKHSRRHPSSGRYIPKDQKMNPHGGAPVDSTSSRGSLPWAGADASQKYRGVWTPF
jgi:hypothetical protein